MSKTVPIAIIVLLLAGLILSAGCTTTPQNPSGVENQNDNSQNEPGDTTDSQNNDDTTVPQPPALPE